MGHSLPVGTTGPAMNIAEWVRGAGPDGRRATGAMIDAALGRLVTAGQRRYRVTALSTTGQARA